MNKEVANEDDYGVPVAHIRRFVPPVTEPALHGGVRGPSLEPFLELGSLG